MLVRDLCRNIQNWQSWPFFKPCNYLFEVLNWIVSFSLVRLGKHPRRPRRSQSGTGEIARRKFSRTGESILGDPGAVSRGRAK